MPPRIPAPLRETSLSRPAQVCPPGDFFGAPAFGAGGRSAAGSSGADCWGSTGARGGGGRRRRGRGGRFGNHARILGRSGPAGRTASNSDGDRRDGDQEDRRRRARGKAATLCRRTTTGTAPGAAASSAARCGRASSTAPVTGPAATPDSAPAAAPAPVATAPVRGVDDSGIGVRISGIGLLGVVTPIAATLPRLRDRDELRRVGSSASSGARRWRPPHPPCWR